MGVVDNAGAVVVNDIVPAVLVVGDVHRHAVNFAVGALSDGFGGLIHVLPGPVVRGVGNAVPVEDGLVIEQRDSIVILGKRVDVTVGAGIEPDDPLVVVAKIDGVVFLHVIVQLQQNVVIHVKLDGVGVGPEHVGHRTAGSARLQQRPVVVPVHHFDLCSDAGGFGPFVRDLLESGLLVRVPDVDRQRTGRGAGASGALRAAAGRQREQHGQRKQENSDSFHNVCLLSDFILVR